MYKERVKAGKNPLWLIILWAISIYAISILWGIFQIIAEVRIPYLMQAVMFISTIVFGRYIVSKFITEYEISVSPRYITVTRFLGRKSNPVRTVRAGQILLITENKNELKNFKIKKTENFIRAFQKGNPVYVVYTHNSKEFLLKMKLTDMNAKKTSDKLEKEGI